MNTVGGWFPSESYSSNRGDSKSDDTQAIRELVGHNIFGDIACGISNWLDRAIANSEAEQVLLSKQQLEEKRLKDNLKLLRDFKAWQQCPDCCEFGNFSFEVLEKKDQQKGFKVERICSECQYRWKQS